MTVQRVLLYCVHSRILLPSIPSVITKRHHQLSDSDSLPQLRYTIHTQSNSQRHVHVSVMPQKRKAQSQTEQDKSSEHVHKKTETRQKNSNHHGFNSYPPSKVYRLIEPGPVLLVITGSLKDSTHNIMTAGFHMVMQHQSPPLIGITIGPWDASFAALEQQRECVLAIPSVEMANTVVDIGNCSADDDDDTSKWGRFGLSAVPSGRLKTPLVGDPNIISNIECVVEDSKMVRKYSLWVLRPVKAWINPDKRPGEGGKMFHHRGNGTFVVDGDVLNLQDRMVKWKTFQD